MSNSGAAFSPNPKVKKRFYKKSPSLRVLCRISAFLWNLHLLSSCLFLIIQKLNCQTEPQRLLTNFLLKRAPRSDGNSMSVCEFVCVLPLFSLTASVWPFSLFLSENKNICTDRRMQFTHSHTHVCSSILVGTLTDIKQKLPEDLILNFALIPSLNS